MISHLKNKIYAILLGLFIIIWCVVPMTNSVEARAPRFENHVIPQLEKWGWVLSRSQFYVNNDKTLRENIFEMFYPQDSTSSVIYNVIRDITLGVMIIFIVVLWWTLLLNKKPEESKKHLASLLYILLWWVFIYASNRLFGHVLHFNGDQFTAWEEGIWWYRTALIWRNWVFFVVLSAIKAFAFFLAIIMTVVTWFKVISAWEWEKWKKLVKWLISVVVALLIIKWVDFVYYLSADSATFIDNATKFIVNVARIFGYIYWAVIFVMVLLSWYLYITDGWSGANFKKASNVLINILLSALVLFGFLLIMYQIFSEFQEWWDALPAGSDTAAITTSSSSSWF